MPNNFIWIRSCTPNNSNGYEQCSSSPTFCSLKCLQGPPKWWFLKKDF